MAKNKPIIKAFSLMTEIGGPSVGAHWSDDNIESYKAKAVINDSISFDDIDDVIPAVTVIPQNLVKELGEKLSLEAEVSKRFNENLKDDPIVPLEPRSVSEPRSNVEPASKKNLVDQKLEKRKLNLDDFEKLTTDEIRFLRFLNMKYEETDKIQIFATRDEIQSVANINRGRFHSTRRGLVEKNFIVISEATNLKTRNTEVYYTLIK